MQDDGFGEQDELPDLVDPTPATFRPFTDEEMRDLKRSYMDGNPEEEESSCSEGGDHQEDNLRLEDMGHTDDYESYSGTDYSDEEEKAKG